MKIISPGLLIDKNKSLYPSTQYICSDVLELVSTLPLFDNIDSCLRANLHFKFIHAKFALNLSL